MVTNKSSIDIRKKELFVSDYITSALKDYGSIKWYKNSNHSFYIKFKDVRLGSIRISNHNGRTKYRYKYDINVKKVHNLIETANKIISQIVEKANSLHDFNPDLFVVWDNEERKYRTVETFKEYKNIILKRS